MSSTKRKKKTQPAKTNGVRAGYYTTAGPIVGGATQVPAPTLDTYKFKQPAPDAPILTEAVIQQLQADNRSLRERLHKAEHQPQVRVLRLIEFAGERDAVMDQVRQSIHGTVEVRQGKVLVTAVTLHEYPEVLKIARSAPAVKVDAGDGQDANRPTNGQRRY